MPKSDAVDSGEEQKTPRVREHSEKELTGSRWAGLMLLFITIIISLLFYLQGKLATKDAPALDETGSTDQGLFGTKTYRFEK